MSIYMILQTESVISVSKGGNMGNLNETPSANRLHIGIYGKTNSGKSSLINAVTKQEVSIVADVAGTTTDPVYKPMEIHPLGPCVIIDTAGFDDDSELGERRVEKTHLAAEKTDIAVVVLDIAEVIAAKKAGVPFKKAFKDEAEWSLLFAKKHTPVVFALNKIDEILLSAEAQEKSRGKLDNAAIEAAKCWVYEENSAVMGKNADNSFEVVAVSALKGKGMDAVISALTRLLPEDFGQEFILGDLVSQTDLVLLVMPQSRRFPNGAKGNYIYFHVQACPPLPEFPIYYINLGLRPRVRIRLGFCHEIPSVGKDFLGGSRKRRKPESIHGKVYDWGNERNRKRKRFERLLFHSYGPDR